MSAKLSMLRTRMRTVASVKKIVNAMKTIAVSQLKKYQLLAKHANTLFLDISRHISLVSVTHTTQREKVLIIFGAHQSFCSNFNNRILHILSGLDVNQYQIFCIGKYTFDTICRVYDVQYLCASLKDIHNILNLINKFACTIMYYRFFSIFTNEIQMEDVLLLKEQTAIYTIKQYSNPLDIMYKIYVKALIQSCLLNSQQSECGMRIVSMEGASKNADKVSHEIQILYNCTRQELITNDISEVNAGMESLIIE